MVTHKYKVMSQTLFHGYVCIIRTKRSFIHVCIIIRTKVCVCVCMRAYACVYIYIYTHTHTCVCVCVSHHLSIIATTGELQADMRWRELNGRYRLVKVN